MNECNWKDGKMDHCNLFDGQMIYEIKKYDNGGIDVKNYKCLHCHGSMQKPEEEKPLIVKSGETWVKYENGINSLWMHGGIVEPPELRLDLNESQIKAFKQDWKSFTGPNPDITELTDEIALLRPMVMVRNHVNNIRVLGKLIYIGLEHTQDEPYKYYTPQNVWANCRLAIAHECYEAKNVL